MIKDLFLDNGYLNIDTIYNDPSPFVFVIGARGVGKTYGALKYCIDNNIKFIYLRTKDTIVKKLSSTAMNPFKVINENEKRQIEVKTRNTGGVPTFLDVADHNRVVGYMLPLSTFANFRGFDMSDVRCIIYDEFIPESGEIAYKDQSDTFYNAYETCNRNRELNGQPAVKVLLMSNSNTIFNDFFLSLRLTKKVYSMMQKEHDYYTDPDRGLSLYNIIDSPISEAKSETALYKLTKGNDFQVMALKNKYVIENEHLIKSFNLSQFKAVVGIGEIYVYRNPSNIYYMSTFKKGHFPKEFTMTEADRITYRHQYLSVWSAYLDNRLYFEDIYCLEAFNVIYY